ncbi:DUF6234 family protein [Streptacidiphilus jiangxiensis]|uniref:DUF6234 domain-containing protein n=1 Tax=Streptacidiphilus jiangxiensis TaxID=235985 RepID=A0A1H7YDE0_STRJI|nr:DUF6234 family protein [Streptacidiphilus jiangxiensis]SEM44242.1 hypothetical protein SAMN05414137_12840 [Streptacidiphilus jiangxiensis]
MTDLPTDPVPDRRWPRRGLAPVAPDIALGFALLVLDAMAYLWQEVRYDVVGWAGGVPRATLDADQLTGIAFMEHLVIAVLVVAGLALLLRAPWTLASQGLAAVALLLLLSVAQKDYADSHPAPTPTPSIVVAPCYSGSHGPTCR